MKKKNTATFVNVGSMNTYDVIADLEMVGVKDVVRVTKETIEVKVTEKIDFVTKLLEKRGFV